MTNTNEAVAGALDLASIAVAGGSVTGRDHRRLDRPCQDAWATVRGDAAVVVAVCDGCGSGRRSEVGAALGARLWCRAVMDAVARGGALDDAGLWRAASQQVLAALRAMLDALGGDPVAMVIEHFLFTSVVAAVTPRHAAVIGFGDGVFAIDDDVRVLGPFADDQPPYLGYGLLGEAPAPTAHVVVPTPSMTSILLATDGAAQLVALDPDAGLAGFWRDDRFVRNPDAIRRRLAVVNREHITVDDERGTLVRGGQPLGDDTTIAVLRRRS